MSGRQLGDVPNNPLHPIPRLFILGPPVPFYPVSVEGSSNKIDYSKNKTKKYPCSNLSSLDPQRTPIFFCLCTLFLGVLWQKKGIGPLGVQALKSGGPTVDGCEIRFSHHLETMVETIAYWKFTGEPNHSRVPYMAQDFVHPQDFDPRYFWENLVFHGKYLLFL